MKNSRLFRTSVLAAGLLLQLGTLCFRSHGAAGDVDLSFDPGSGVNGFVWAVVTQPDGRVIIGGEFTTVKGLSRTNVARLNADGSGDPTFDAGPTVRDVRCLALQPDGKMLVAGDVARTYCDEFGDCYTYYPRGVTRLNVDGSLDHTFASATVATGRASSIALQSDGKVLIGGSFDSVNGTNRNGIARLNADGSLDTSFNPGTGFFGYPGGVYSIAVQPDGKLLIGGGFTAFNGMNRGGIARLNNNGSLDTTFNPGAGFAGLSGVYAFSIALQPDGKLLVGGNFTSFNGTNRHGIARLNANGSLDLSFDPGTGVADNPNRRCAGLDAEQLHLGW